MGSPSGSVCRCSGGHVETQSPDIEVFHNGLLPCLFWSSHLSLAMRCPFEGCCGDGVGGQTCLNHRHHNVCMISARVSIPVLLLSSSFEMVLGQ